MRTLTLTKTAKVTLDGSGNGTAQIGPASAGEVWYPDVVSVSAATNVAEASCKIFAGPLIAPFTFVDGTLSGSTGDSTGKISGKVIRPGLVIFAQWAGGDPGAVATMNIYGNRAVP
jgi:hypothetical protein